ncbi:hypothetical protein [Dysgonomonas macrotermitis]|uniref:Uncharacterized protein n=1 Tax=Dysgonomonas macrotermitis TaxID=1346286 RepID=A0A1M5EQV2_9BACT|nr:hypothetical protein [Dysgonomonas macrotermitis]SHF81599.1 hypothetical protein SAMN05444362_110113 [Dysgonomonas macrotermitis]
MRTKCLLISLVFFFASCGPSTPDAQIYDIQDHTLGLSCKIKNISGGFRTRLDAIVKVKFDDGTTEKTSSCVYDLDAGDVQEAILQVSVANQRKRIISWEIVDR